MAIEAWLPRGSYSLVSKRLAGQDEPLLWAWREAPLKKADSGWRFLGLHDTKKSLSSAPPVVVDAAALFALEPAIQQIWRYPVGADFQLATQNGGKFFVYNDTLGRVTPVESTAGYPLDEAAFRTHFADFAQAVRAYDIETTELARLNEAADTLDLLVSVLLGTRSDTVPTAELTILFEIGRGFQDVLRCDYPDIPPKRFKNLLPALFQRRFQVPLTTSKRLLRTSEGDAADEVTRTISQHLQAYGRRFYHWLDSKQYATIHRAYERIRRTNGL